MKNNQKFRYKNINKSSKQKTMWRGVCLIVSVVFTISCIVASIVFYSLSASPYYNDFDKFKNKYNKKYTSKQMHADRLRIYEENVKRINEFNAGEHGYKLEANEFADLTDEEFYAKKLLREFNGTVAGVKSGPLKREFKRIDWENKMGVLRDEGDCGASWAHSSIAAIETSYFRNDTNKYKRLSYQELLDCVIARQENFSCSAGDPCAAFNYVKEHGISSFRDYPGDANGGKCFNDVTKRVFRLKVGCKVVQPNSSIALAHELQQSPISVFVASSSFGFRFYKSGIITKGCDGHLGHYATLVGTDKDSEGRMYWKVQNTWGPSWGDKGYVKILREDKGNSSSAMCNITLNPSYPV